MLILFMQPVGYFYLVQAPKSIGLGRHLGEQKVGRDTASRTDDGVQDIVQPLESNVSKKSSRGQMSAWQACGLWLVVVGIFLSVVPKAFKRHGKAGKRSE